MPGSSTLRQAIEAAACLCGQRDERLSLAEEDGRDRQTLRLCKRLEAYYDDSGTSKERRSDNLEKQTGDSALHALRAIHEALLVEDQPVSSQSSSTLPPKLGARDLKTINLLLSIVSNWNLNTLLTSFDQALVALQYANSSGKPPAKLQELPDEVTVGKMRQMGIKQYIDVCATSSNTLDQMNVLVGVQGTHSEISNVIVQTCAPSICALAIRLAWGPNLQRGDREGGNRRHGAAALLTNILRSQSTSSCLQILSAAGHVQNLTTKEKGQTPIPSFVKSATERLYSAQLLRTDAIMALLKNVFGSEEEHGSDLMKKLAGVGHLLSTPPPNMSSDIFASIIVPRLMDVISELPTSSLQGQEQSPSRLSTITQKTAACFALARLYEVAPEEMTKSVGSTIWQHLLPEHSKAVIANSQSEDRVHASVQLLHQIIEYSEPSTTFLSFLIRPVVMSLFTLTSFMTYHKSKSILEVKGKTKEIDSPLSTMVSSLLKTWLRLADVGEACDMLGPRNTAGLFATSGSSVGAINQGEEDGACPYWDRREGYICFSWKKAESSADLSAALSSLKVQDLQMLLNSDQEAEMAPPSFLSALQLSPSPRILASLLKESSRKDIASQILSDLLQSYSVSKQVERSLQGRRENTTDSILCVQHILELINVFGSEVLSGQADKILAFINFALGSPEEVQTDSDGQDASDVPFLKANSPQGSLAGLTSIGKKMEKSSKEEDDDEEPDEELVETALNLLLSLLEGSPDISTKSHSILKVITVKLDVQISRAISSEIRSLAKEARLVLTARQSSKAPPPVDISSNNPIQQAFARGNETYQEALRLLQDPILPVRAHGLVLLKELAACGSTDVGKGKLMDPALTPAILDIYIQAIQDDESFLYLNAVKGIAEMANTGGKSMIKRLVSLYLTDVKYTKEQVDMQLRMGEALLQVIQKLEEALSAHVDEIVQPLLTSLRQSNRPTTLRSSYLSILGTCVEACPSAFSTTLLGDAIVDGMLDLLTVEMSQVASLKLQQDMQDPTNIDAKQPQLRRAAILLLALFIRGSRHQLEAEQERKDGLDMQQEERLTALRLPNGSIMGGESFRNLISVQTSLLFAEHKTQRTKSLLGYLAQTDSDSLVRHQSQELLDELDLLTLARIVQ